MPAHFLVRLFLALMCLAGPVLAGEAPVSYRHDVQPILERKCVACHACYDAPCQLNLGSGDGLLRGATRLKVYDSKRTRAQAPTRLFTDAETVSEWQRKGFSPVLDGAGDSLLAGMLELGRKQTFKANEKLPADIPIGINASYACPLEAHELPAFARRFPHRGMPLGVTGLSDEEYLVVRSWLDQGAPVDSEEVKALPAEETRSAAWETLLNQSGRREQLVARWLYEHLFLARLYFADVEGGHFFELVRSRTPAPQPIDLIATPQPNHPPGTMRVYYRLRPLQGALVHKTHIIYALTPEKIQRIQSLFFSGDWQASALPGYGETERANPFLTFAAIPARARYQFMLDDAEYFVRTFIRGPVCRGSIATDVIRDHFWLLFQRPDRDLYITSAAHRTHVDPLLGLPGQRNGISDLLPQWTRYTRLRNQYSVQRERDYARAQPQGAAFEDIWNGDGHNRNALQTIVRHHDSASVSKGLHGEIPQTIWWMDYPLFERTYYSLVVNFNVFDTVSHQAQTRLYFDLIRHGAETNFLRLMPPAARKPLLDDWYQSSARIKAWLYYPPLDIQHPSAVSYATKSPKQELAREVLSRFAAINTPDPINRCEDKRCYRADAPVFARVADQTLSRLAARPAAELPFIKLLPEATLLRVHTTEGMREIYTLLRNRAHSNVAYMAGEALRYRPEQDTLTVYPGILTSYPNFAFNVKAEDITDFSAALQSAGTAADLDRIVRRWGVRRTHPAFWELFHDYTVYLREREPREAAILDMNRYGNF